MFGHPVYESFFYRASRRLFPPLLRSEIYMIRRNWIWTSGTNFADPLYLARFDSMKFSRIKISIIRPFRFQNILVNGNEISRRSVAHIVSSPGDRVYFFSDFFLALSLSLFSVPSTTLSPLYIVWRKLPRSNNDEKLVTDDSRIGGGTLDFCFTSYRFHAAFKYSISPLTLVTVLRRAEDSSRLHHARLNPRIAVPIWIVVFPL